MPRIAHHLVTSNKPRVIPTNSFSERMAEKVAWKRVFAKATLAITFVALAGMTAREMHRRMSSGNDEAKTPPPAQEPAKPCVPEKPVTTPEPTSEEGWDKKIEDDLMITDVAKKQLVVNQDKRCDAADTISKATSACNLSSQLEARRQAVMALAKGEREKARFMEDETEKQSVKDGSPPMTAEQKADQKFERECDDMLKDADENKAFYEAMIAMKKKAFAQKLSISGNCSSTENGKKYSKTQAQSDVKSITTTRNSYETRIKSTNKTLENKKLGDKTCSGPDHVPSLDEFDEAAALPAECTPPSA